MRGWARAGAVDLETGQTIMKDVLTVDALSTILLLTAIEAMYPAMRWIHVFLDNARYHHAKLVQAWLAQPGRRIKLHFIPAYCPHLNPACYRSTDGSIFRPASMKGAKPPLTLLHHVTASSRTSPVASQPKDTRMKL
jgi:hypothetical protein